MKKHSERTQEGEPRQTLCNIDYTSEDGYLQTKLTPKCVDEQIDDEREPLSILEETVAVMKLAPLEHAQTMLKTAEFPSRSSSTRLLTIA